MKNQYFADINDYRKYGILRTLSSQGQISTLVCWMLTENDNRNDGNFTSYLTKKEKYQQYDPDLFNILYNCIASGTRNVNAAPENNIIPNAGYYNTIIPDNKTQRENYFSSLYPLAKNYDLVFLDPDNGIEIKSKGKGSKYSSKYLYYDEISNLWSLGNSLLIYQHFIREERSKFIERISNRIQGVTGSPEIFPLQTPHVVYFLVPQPRLKVYFEDRIDLINSTWGKEITWWPELFL